MLKNNQNKEFGWVWKRKENKRKIVSMMYARIKHKKEKKKEKKKEVYVRIRINESYTCDNKSFICIWYEKKKKWLCRRASYHMGTYEFKFFRHIRKP